MFADTTRRTLSVTSEAGTFDVTIQKLSHRSLKIAADNRQIEVTRGMREMGGDVFKAIQSIDPNRQTDPAAKKRAHYAQYDRDTILVQGIVNWSITAEKNEPNIARLELQIANQLHEAIVDLSDPFVTPEEAKISEEKDSGRSTSS